MKLSGKLVALLCCLALLTACNKNKDKNASTTKKALQDGLWQMTSYIGTYSYNGQTATRDFFSEMEECEKDDFLYFAADGKSTIDDAVKRCEGTPQVGGGVTWALLDNDKRLAIVDKNPDTFDIEISNTQMKLKLTKTNASGIPVDYISTYKNLKQ